MFIWLIWLVAAVLFIVSLRKFRTAGLTYVMLIRVPLLFMAGLLIGPFVLSSRGSELLWNLFVLESGLELGLTIALFFPAFWVGAAAIRSIWHRGPERFGIQAPRLNGKYGPWLYRIAQFGLPLIPSALLVSKSTITGSQGVIAFITVAVALVAYESLNRFAQFLAKRLERSRLVQGRMPLVASALSTLGPVGRDGYLDPDGRLCAEHVKMFAASFAFVIIYGLGYWVWEPRPEGGLHLPALGYLLLLSTWLIALLSGMTFFLDRLRVPLLGGLALWVYFAHTSAETDHYFEIRDLPKSPALPVAKTSLDKWTSAHPDDPLIIVCAEGGGIQSASWTVQVLTGLREAYPERFTDSLRMVSGVSGGSVGLMYFLHGLQNGADRDAILSATNASSLASVGWGLVYPDFLRLLSPLDIFERDRGWALEQNWRSHMYALASGGDSVAKARRARSSEATLAAWVDATREGNFPAVALNSTVVETGEQFLFRTFRFWPQESDELPSRLDLRDFFDTYPDKDVDIVSAARLSATFPYVTPAARARDRDAKDMPVEPTHHLVDGGYFDNLGLTSAALWLWSCFATPYPKQDGSLVWHLDNEAFANCGPVIFLLIRGFPEEKPKDGQGTGFSAAFLGPLKTLLSTRSTGQFSRNERELQALRLVAQCSEALEDVHIIEVRPPQRGESDVPFSLSWHLTRDQIDRNNSDWTATLRSLKDSVLDEALQPR